MTPVSLKAAGLALAGSLLVCVAYAAKPALPAPDKTLTNPAPAAPSSDEIPLAPSSAAATTVASAPNAWGGQRTGNEATLSDRVVNYDIAATLDPVKHTVDGHELLTWRNRSDRIIKSVYLHLYMNAFEGYGSTFMSEHRYPGFEFRSDVPIHDGEWGHIELTKVQQNSTLVKWSFVHPDGGPQTDHTVVRFDLPTPVAPGASTTLEIDFHDALPRVVARTGYYGTFHLIGQWFPKIAVLELPGERGVTAPRWNAHEFHLHSEFYADFGTFDVKLTVPKDYTVGAVGEETGAPVEKDGMVTHRFVQGDVHDFAWTADNQTGTPLEGVYNGPGSPTVKIRVLFPKQYEGVADATLKATIKAVTYFSKTLGPYPYKTITAVVPPYNADEAGGMEYPTFFTAEGHREITPGTIDEFTQDFVTVHEFGHGYFYGILASNEFEEPMLDEGMNEFWDWHLYRDDGYAIPLSMPFMKTVGIDLRATPYALARAGAMLHSPKDGTGANSWDRYSSMSYNTVYERTAVTLRDLEARLGKPVFERAMKEYYNRWKFRHPGIADLRDTFSDVSGQRDIVEKAFKEQVYSAHRVDDRIKSLEVTEELPLAGTVNVDGKWVETTQEALDKQIDKTREDWDKAHPDAKKTDPGPFPWRTSIVLLREGTSAPQKIVVKFADDSTETVIWDDHNRWARFSWVKPVKGVSAVLDPDGVQFLDENLLDNTRTAKADHAPALRWTSDLMAAFQSALALLFSF